MKVRANQWSEWRANVFGRAGSVAGCHGLHHLQHGIAPFSSSQASFP
jgi:hypothetical protein